MERKAKELLNSQKQQELAAASRKKNAEEELRKKREERERLMESFKRPSKAVQLGNRFLTNLGDQKNEVAKKAAKMDQRAARMASSSALPVNEAPKAKKVSVKDLAPNAEDDDLTEEESDDGFVNPFVAA
jgi:hypothetical protein